MIKVKKARGKVFLKLYIVPLRTGLTCTIKAGSAKLDMRVSWWMKWAMYESKNSFFPAFI